MFQSGYRRPPAGILRRRHGYWAQQPGVLSTMSDFECRRQRLWGRRDDGGVEAGGPAARGTHRRTGPPTRRVSELTTSQFRRLGRLPLATPQPGQQYRRTPSHISHESSRPGSRHICAGNRSANQRTPTEFIPESIGHRGFDAICLDFDTSTMIVFPAPT